MKRPCVYILASALFGTLYVGVTSALHRRMAEHTQGIIEGFTRRYGISRLVYYEFHETMVQAIAREKRLKKWNRSWKYRLLEQSNPEWVDLFDATTGEIAMMPVDAARLDDEPEPG